MAKLFNRAKMTTATTGSGTVTLGSASNGFQTFAAAGVLNGDVVQYVIEEGANFEIGTGTYSSSGTSLTRSPTESSNSNNAITLAGQATVSITATHADFSRLQHDGSDKVTVSSTGASVTGNLAVSGTVDGRDVASDGSKLDGIEANAKNDQTITAGGGLTGGGTGDVTISHSDTSSQASVNGSGRTYIQDITLDTYGHVTGLATATETVVNTDTNTIPNNATITLSAGGALTGGGNFTTDQSSNETITFNHSDTSSQGSVNNSSGTVIQDVTLDGYGHVTGLASVNLDGRYYTESEADSRFVNVTGDTMTGNVSFTSTSVPITTNSVKLINTENDSNYYTDAEGVLAYDANFNADTTYGTGSYSPDGAYGADGGGLVFRGSDGWAGVIDTRNMQWLHFRPEAITMTGDLTIPNKIIHSGDTDTYFQFHGANLARMVLAGAEVQEWGANYTLFSDNDTVRLGSGSDFRMWFDGSHTYFRNYAHSGGNIYFQGEDTEGTNHALLYMDNGGSSPYLRLYQNGGERLRTLSGGVGVTGLTVGTVNANPHNAGGLNVSNGTDEKIVLSGSSNPHIRWQEGTTDKAYIQWNTDGHLMFRNQESGNFRFRSHATTQAVNIKLEASDGDLYGSVYGNHNNEIGFLDQDGHWAYRHTNSSLHEWRINNTVEMSLGTSTLDMKGNTITEVEDIGLRDRIYHDDDTNTYMQFHAADQWRVVTGGTERLEVTNSQMLVNNDIRVVDDAGIHVQTDTNAAGAKITMSDHSPSGLQFGTIEYRHSDGQSFGSGNAFKFFGSEASMSFHVSGQGYFTGDVATAYSDERLKDFDGKIEGALDKLSQINGYYYHANDTAVELGYDKELRQVGVSAQEVEAVMPEVIAPAAIDPEYKTVHYDRLVPLLIEAIKEQQNQIDDLKAEIQSMKS